VTIQRSKTCKFMIALRSYYLNETQLTILWH
jgi:hypothetical protein